VSKIGGPTPGRGDRFLNKPETVAQEPPAIREGFGVLLQLARALANG